MPPASHQAVLDLQHADLRVLHPQAALEGACVPGYLLGMCGVCLLPACCLSQSNGRRCHEALSALTAEVYLEQDAPPQLPPQLPPLPCCSSLPQGDFPLHWPLVNSDHMRDRLGKRELERKRVEDASRLQLEDPTFRWGRWAGCCGRSHLGRQAGRQAGNIRGQPHQR
jgi:hypothetical protein